MIGQERHDEPPLTGAAWLPGATTDGDKAARCRPMRRAVRKPAYGDTTGDTTSEPAPVNGGPRAEHRPANPRNSRRYASWTLRIGSHASSLGVNIGRTE